MLAENISGIVGERLSLEAFSQLSGRLGGTPFVKVIVDRPSSDQAGKKPIIHFLNHSQYQFHSDYIAENILGIRRQELDRDIDDFNQAVYLDPKRRFYLGIVALQRHLAKDGREERFFTLETVEIDTMDAEMVRFFYGFVKESVDPTLPLLFKPANHLQEKIARELDPVVLPRVFPHELFASARFIALNHGRARGRLRAFKSEEEYKKTRATLEWYDIIVMHRVPEDIPRILGIINAHPTTPLSHTNVLASGWQIPNAVQIGIFDRIEKEYLDNQWVEYEVDPNQSEIRLDRIDRPEEIASRPAWSVQRIKLEEPEVLNIPIVELERLKMSDRHRYGTKAAHLGELKHLLDAGSPRLLGFYRIKRPPRAHLLQYLERFLELPENSDPQEISAQAAAFLRKAVLIPRGIALPFSIQQEFLESSPRIQQMIGKLKMALELGAREIDSLCLSLQSMIRQTRIPERLRVAIDTEIANQLGGVSSFVVRSSSNAEDLEDFSAAGIYESINHVTTAENIFQSIKEVWASLVSPRSVRLRHDVGISLDDCYMGVIIQDEVKAELGGVMVTTNPMNRADFRNVYINALPRSVSSIVKGSEPPYQYLYNTVEGGGRTVSLGNAKEDLSEARRASLQALAFSGRLLQSHFSPDYTFSTPLDIEWALNSDGLYVLQVRPYTQ